MTIHCHLAKLSQRKVCHFLNYTISKYREKKKSLVLKFGFHAFVKNYKLDCKKFCKNLPTVYASCLNKKQNSWISNILRNQRIFTTYKKLHPFNPVSIYKNRIVSKLFLCPSLYILLSQHLSLFDPLPLPVFEIQLDPQKPQLHVSATSSRHVPADCVLEWEARGSGM